MTKRKSPELLEQLVLRKICKIIGYWVMEWTHTLLFADGLAHSDRLPMIQSVLGQCVQLRQVLASLPVPFGRPLSVQAVEIVAIIMKAYNIADRFRHGRPVTTCRRRYEEVCLFIINTMWLPCVVECNVNNVACTFVQELLSKLLKYYPNITHLVLPHEKNIEMSRYVLSNLRRLTELLDLKFQFVCTTEIVIELGKHCKLLRSLDIAESKSVTDDCVEYLMNLQSLEVLRINGTSISEACYALILSSLPRVQNITWWDSVERILQNVTKECLPSVNDFLGTVSDSSFLAKMCPRIKRLSIRLLNGNSLELSRLTDVKFLGFVKCDYNINILSIVVENIGFRLTYLEMFWVENIIFSQIFTCCTVLKKLVLRFSEVILHDNEIFSPELPHFKSVAEIILLSNTGLNNFRKHLHHYVNLKILRTSWFEALEDDTVSEILNAGGFKKLSCILLGFCGPLTLQTANLLITRCDDLSVIGNLNTWSGVSEEDKSALFDFVNRNNLELTVILD
ncbi:uncharacterized protein LOC110835594 [Zootermopsis nevadensis]|uniref:uncharacterized protein LOC110835594 n=1 Tax=Zootermopsis nevadensis TaxID=136037 RepID=UPI000B8ECC0C|nr:uncharacterized protein LOC110835594 [Zootermopsis nevadensis]